MEKIKDVLIALGLAAALVLASIDVSASTKIETRALVARVAFEAEVPPDLLVSICTVESSLNPKAINRNDGGKGRHSIGLCQIQLRTAKWLGFRGTQKELYDPETNARFAAKYLRYQLGRYDHIWTYAIAAYNAGSVRRRVNRKIINYWYVQRVMKVYYRIHKK